MRKGVMTVQTWCFTLAGLARYPMLDLAPGEP